MTGKRETLHPTVFRTRQHRVALTEGSLFLVWKLMRAVWYRNGCGVIQGEGTAQLSYKVSSGFLSPRASDLVGHKGLHM